MSQQVKKTLKDKFENTLDICKYGIFIGWEDLEDHPNGGRLVNVIHTTDLVQRVGMMRVLQSVIETDLGNQVGMNQAALRIFEEIIDRKLKEASENRYFGPPTGGI